MSKLKKEIKKLKANIYLKDLLIKHQSDALEEKFSTKKIITPLIIAGFIAGFFFSRKKTAFQLVRSSLLAYFAFKRIQVNALGILSLLKKRNSD